MTCATTLQLGEFLTGLCWVGGCEDGIAGNKDIGTNLLQLLAGLHIHAAIHLDKGLTACSVEQTTEFLDLLQSVGKNDYLCTRI